MTSPAPEPTTLAPPGVATTTTASPPAKSAKHLVIFWNPNDGDAQVAELAAALADKVDLVIEADYDRAFALAKTHRERLGAFIAKAGTTKQHSGQALLSEVHRTFGTHIFTVLFSRTISRDPKGRLAAADMGIDMVSHIVRDTAIAIERATMMPVLNERLQNPSTFKYDCPFCPIKSLDHLSLWYHMPLFHTPQKKAKTGVKCPLCAQPVKLMVVHIHDDHAPPLEHVDQSRSGIPLYSFGLVVVRRKRDGKFLVVQEYGAQGYWLPGGGIDAGEMPTTAAERECREEAGVRIKLTGLLRVEMSPSTHGTRLRFIFYGEPVDEDDCEPKTYPDFESVGACWVSVEEIASGQLQLRGEEPVDWFQYVACGGQIHSIDIITDEGAPPPGNFTLAATNACC